METSWQTCQMNWPVYRQASGCQAVTWMISPSQGAPAGLGLGSHLPWGQAPDPPILSVQVNISMYISPEVGYQISQVAVTEDPITLYGSVASSGGMPMTNVGLLSTDSSPHGAHVISKNLGRGHGGLWSDCSGITTWGGEAGTSVFPMVVGWSSPWATNRDPCWWAQSFSCDCDGVSWGGLHWPGQAHLCPIGWHSGCKNFCLHK